MKRIYISNQLILVFFFALFCGTIGFSQGVTTSSIQGQVNDQNGEALIGANLTAVHTPTGTFYGVSTDINGNYRIDNMKVGGPYKITISYTGQESIEITDIYLRLGEPYKGTFVMGESTVLLNEVVVLATAGSLGENSGTSTQISTEAIEKMPTLNRDLSDFTRLTPQASNAGEGTSFGGINNRYNAIYVDGAVNNDVFGLAGSGTNGGQTGISPFSIDIIDQLQVVLSPYDVTYGGFAGAGINAVTKSGTNQFKGTAYYFMQNESLVGKTNGELTDRLNSDREKVAEFNQSTYGASLGGPIVKDKVFFFANVELQDDVTPVPFDVANYTSQDATRAQESDLSNLSEFVNSQYGYNPGTFGDTEDELQGLKIFGKLDFNLNKTNTLTLRHNYTKAEQFNRNGGSASRIQYSNNGIFFPTTTNSSALELNSRFGSNMSNNLIIGYTSVNDDRDPLGDPFPFVIIFDEAGGSINFGSEQFSTANVLEQKIFTITDNFKLYKGKHTFTFGTHNEFYDIRNVFLAWNFGEYEFDSLEDFYNASPVGTNTPIGPSTGLGRASDYTRIYSLVDDIAGDNTAAAAEFGAMQLGFYAQDEISINDKFTLTAGLRLDIPILTDDPEEAPRFNDEVLPRLFSAYPEFDGNVEAGKAPDGQLMISPRVGFNYEVNEKGTLRGGIGIFTSRIPFVWPGAMYNTNGLTSTFIGGFAIPDIVFRPDVQDQYTYDSPTVPSGDMNLFTNDFKYPQVLRGNLGYDSEIGDGWNTSLEVSYTKTLNNVRYTNLNTSAQIEGRLTGSGDDRPIFVNSEIDDDDFTAVYLASNTDQGYAINVTGSVNKEIVKNLNFSLAYTFGDSYALFEGTSSQNSSQWRGAVSVNGRNDASYGRSDFALGSRVITSIDYKAIWTENVSTTFSIFYNGQSGLPMSYVIGGSSAARNLNNERGSTSRWRSLVYVPADQNDINLIDIVDGDGNVTSSAAQQWANLDAFIEDDKHLSDRRGKYAEKNGGRAPWVNMIDIAIRQDFGADLGGNDHRFQISLDIFNVANLLNKNWGTRYNIPGDFNNYELLNFEGFEADGTTPQYTYRETSTGTDTYDISDLTSRWRARLGFRYIFN
jgi:outer membrane receptor for ferrienterochelin and colicin